MKGNPPSYEQLLRELEVERYAPPVPPPLPVAADLSPTTPAEAAERRRQLYADSLAFGEGKDLRTRLRAVS